MSRRDTTAAGSREVQERRRDRTLRLGVFVSLALYFTLTHFLIGIRGEHIVLSILLAVLAIAHRQTLRLLIYAAPLILTGISYDFVRFLTRFRGEIHVDDIYHWELALFGVGHGETAQVPALWFLDHTHRFLDFVCGIAYMTYVYVPILLSVVMYFFARERGRVVGIAFLATNLIGIAIYLLFPAAPPWYVHDYGLGPADLSAVPNAAGTLRFDEIIGVPYFEEYYKRSANVFGAVPSLHTAYPLSSALVTWRLGWRWRAPLVGFAALVGFSAVYLQHHYILDVIAGVVCAAAGTALAEHVFSARELGSARLPEETEVSRA
ncbi:MAG: phosphatase PAP2 family protein [Myxococcota bacterium]